MLNIGLIGTGRIGKTHVSNINRSLSQYHVAGVFDPMVDYEWANSNHIETYSSLDALLDSNIDAVMICSPSKFHTDQIIQVANANKHIFCEKPIGLDIDQIEEAPLAWDRRWRRRRRWRGVLRATTVSW